MDWNALGAIGEIVGAIAVVATLFHMSGQLKQNTKSVQSSAYSAWSTGINDLYGATTTHPHLDRILHDGWLKGELTEDTWMTFLMWHLQYFYHVEAVWQMYKRGTLDQEIYDLEMGRTVRMLAIPTVKQWWEAGGRDQVSAPLAKELERISSNQFEYKFFGWTKEDGFVARTIDDV